MEVTQDYFTRHRPNSVHSSFRTYCKLLASSIKHFLSTVESEFFFSRDFSRNQYTVRRSQVQRTPGFSAPNVTEVRDPPPESLFNEYSPRLLPPPLGQQFRTQFYMDRHMENKHADRLDKAEGSWGCLADLCDALGCGRHAGDQCGDRRGGAAPERNSACGKCDASEMDHRRYKCKALFHRCAIAIWRPSMLGNQGI